MIGGDGSLRALENSMNATGIKMMSSQNESVLEKLPQLNFFLLLLLFDGGDGKTGIQTSFTSSSRCTANGGSFPHDPIRTRLETRAVHQNRRTAPATATQWPRAYATRHTHPTTVDRGPATRPSGATTCAQNRQCPRPRECASPQFASPGRKRAVRFHSTPSRCRNSKRPGNPPAADV